MELGLEYLARGVRSPRRSVSSKVVRTISTFSRDIAHAVSRDGEETHAESSGDLVEVVDQRQEDARSQSERSMSHDSAQVAFHGIIRYL